MKIIDKYINQLTHNFSGRIFRYLIDKFDTTCQPFILDLGVRYVLRIGWSHNQRNIQRINYLLYLQFYVLGTVGAFPDHFQGCMSGYNETQGYFATICVGNPDNTGIPHVWVSEKMSFEFSWSHLKASYFHDFLLPCLGKVVEEMARNTRNLYSVHNKDLILSYDDFISSTDPSINKRFRRTRTLG